MYVKIRWHPSPSKRAYTVCVSPVWVAPLVVWVASSVCRAPSYVWAPSVWVGPLLVPPLLCLILST